MDETRITGCWNLGAGGLLDCAGADDICHPHAGRTGCADEGRGPDRHAVAVGNGLAYA